MVAQEIDQCIDYTRDFPVKEFSLTSYEMICDWYIRKKYMNEKAHNSIREKCGCDLEVL